MFHDGLYRYISWRYSSWSSQLKNTTAISTTEAEIIAASEGTNELVQLNRLLSVLLSGVAKRTQTLYIDNASAVKLAKYLEYH
jgi:hypothetical protein